SVFVIGSNDSLHVLNKDPQGAVSQDLNNAIQVFRLIGTYERPLGGDLKLTISPSWGTDSITLAGAEAGATGPFTSVAVTDHEVSYRMRVHGRVGAHATLDTGLDLLSRVTSYNA